MNRAEKYEFNRFSNKFLVDMMRPIGEDHIIKNIETYTSYFQIVDDLYIKCHKKRHNRSLLYKISNIIHWVLFVSMILFHDSFFPWTVLTYALYWCITISYFCLYNKIERYSIFDLINHQKINSRAEYNAVLICKELYSQYNHIYPNNSHYPKLYEFECLAYAIIADSKLSNMTNFNSDINLDMKFLTHLDIEDIIKIYKHELSVPMPECGKIPQYIIGKYKY